MKKIGFLTFFLLVGLPICLLSKDYNILDFGAVPDGQTLNTKAIQAAIDQAHTDGGGRVIFPKGQFLSGSIIMKSGVELHLEKKGVLLGSTDPKQYPNLNRWKALVLADSADNIAISGQGILDGQGARLALNIDSLFYIGKIDSVAYQLAERRPKWYLRPQLVEFVNCNNIRVTGVTFKDAACWVQTYERCERIVIDDIRVDSDAYWNNDGIDIVDCRNVRITNSYINSADDGICLKSYVTHLYDHPTIAYCDSIFVSNCTVRSSASAVKFGSAGFGGFRNVVIEKIKVFDTYRSAIAIELVNGGILENVVVDGIKAVNTGNAIFVRLGEIHRAPGILRNVVIRNVKVQVPFDGIDDAYEIRGPKLPFFHNVFPSSIVGLPGHPVENLTLENIEITYPGRGNAAFANLPLSRVEDVPERGDKYPEFSMFGELPAWGFYVRHVKGLTMRNIKIRIKKPDYRPAMVFDDVKGLKLSEIEVVGDEKPGDPLYFHKVEGLEKE